MVYGTKKYMGFPERAGYPKMNGYDLDNRKMVVSPCQQSKT